MEINKIHNLFINCSGAIIDTRKIISNSMFFALKGENLDANIFSKEALEKGASYVIIDNPKYYIDERTIIVDDVLKTLQELSKHHRKYLNIPVIALTGSNGKTTTKELINVVLSKKYNVKATIGNLNNHIGVPLTLLSFNKSTEIGIVEMGANHQKEIEFLCNLTTPDYGYITNFGKAHLEGFGGIEGVIIGKSELYEYLKINNKTAFINLEDEIQKNKTEYIKRFTFSTTTKSADIFIQEIIANPFVQIIWNKIKIESNLIGLYNSLNITAAITIGHFFNINPEEIKEAIESYIPTNNRSQLIVKNSNEIILDAYNANPSSMIVALENFFQLAKKNKVIMLGDMFELGKESLTEHQNVVNYLEKNLELNSYCYLIGKEFCSTMHPKHKNIYFYQDYISFQKFLLENSLQNKTILIKGSRGMTLERILDIL